MLGTSLTQGGAAAPLTLGYGVPPLRGEEGTAEPSEFSPAELVVYENE